jgi:hypothetical protein
VKACQVIFDRYKDLAQIGQAFRNCKTGLLEIGRLMYPVDFGIVARFRH